MERIVRRKAVSDIANLRQTIRRFRRDVEVVLWRGTLEDVGWLDRSTHKGLSTCVAGRMAPFRVRDVNRVWETPRPAHDAGASWAS